jgi:protein-S-isoprenylcysteine O-methyltransferase Ste14
MRGRGGGWVVAQFVVMAAALGAGLLPPAWPDGTRRALTIVGAMLVAAGIVFAVWAARTLGRSLTPFPRPVPAGLVTTGPFVLVRHPIYTGGLTFFLGYALLSSVLALVLTGVLAILWAGKVRVEERMLAAVYAGYPAYARRVRRRLIPFVY